MIKSVSTWKVPFSKLLWGQFLLFYALSAWVSTWDNWEPNNPYTFFFLMLNGPDQNSATFTQAPFFPHLMFPASGPPPLVVCSCPDSSSFHDSSSNFPRSALCQRNDSELRLPGGVRCESSEATSADLELNLQKKWENRRAHPHS